MKMISMIFSTIYKEKGIDTIIIFLNKQEFPCQREEKILSIFQMIDSKIFIVFIYF